MPAKRRPRSSNTIAQLREDVHEYHVEVKEFMSCAVEKCRTCTQKIDDLDLVVNGKKPEDVNAPGHTSQIADLIRTRKYQVWSLRVAYAVITVVIAFFSYKAKAGW
jgi:hypothetical protein